MQGDQRSKMESIDPVDNPVGMLRNSIKVQDSQPKRREDSKHRVEVTSFVRGRSRLCSRESRGGGLCIMQPPWRCTTHMRPPDEAESIMPVSCGDFLDGKGQDGPSSVVSVSMVHVGQPQPRKSWSPVRIATLRARASATGAQSLGSRGTRRRAARSMCS